MAGKELSSRREFLKFSPRGEGHESRRILRLGRAAMGTRFEVALRSADRAHARDIHSALGEITRLESIFSIFREDSDLCRMNSAAGSGWYEPDPDLWGILAGSLEYCRKTGGSLDISSGALWKLWGFFSKNPGEPEVRFIKETLEKTGYGNILLDEDSGKVKYRKPGLEVNLGATGKGYALDRAAAMLQNRGLANFLLNAGNSTFYAAGSLAGRGAGWKLSVRRPGSRAGDDLALVMLKDMALATSGAGEQFFESESGRFGHVIDPRTGWPSNLHLSTTAIAGDALAADALSTAFFAMEAAEIERYCEKNPGTGALVITGNENGNEREAHLFGIAEEIVEII